MSELIVDSNGNGTPTEKVNEEKLVLQITEAGGQLKINFGTGIQMALISHALRLANLQWDSSIARKQMQDMATSIQPAQKKPFYMNPGLMNKIRKGR